MKPSTFISLMIFQFLMISNCFAQLIVDAGKDTAVCEDITVLTIGGNPTAKGGVPPYTYAWSAEFEGITRIYTASDMLEDTTSSNPIFKKNWIPDSALFYLTVTDANDSLAIDSINVRSSRFGSCLGECRNSIILGDSVKIGHCVFGGIPPYRFSWTPTTSLSDSESETPWAKPLSNTRYELIITDSIGCQTRSSCQVFVDPSSIFSSSENDGNLQVYPNPARSEINIAFENIRSSNSVFDILSSKGSFIRRIDVDDPMITINVQDLLPGIYIYQWKSGTEIIESGKFVIK